ncbi:fatty acid desaturase family protein [Streptomyces bacillaris]|uniref:fatty acid desaturase family protein n=1 Tax=Streptomyces bacillaris TaxID=68179 RepID=UPI003467285E
MEGLRKELGHIRRPVDGKIFTLKLAVLCFLVTCGSTLVLTGSAWLMALGIVLLGLMYAHAIELQHEALHGIGLRSSRANTLAGVLLGIPMLISFAAYRSSHMRHHRRLGTPDNREFFDYGDQYGEESSSPVRSAFLWVYRFSMTGHYAQFLVVCAKLAVGRRLPDERPSAMRGIRRDHALLAGVLAATVTASLLTGSLLAVWLWLLPLAVANPVHALIELPEHYRCRTDTTDVLGNTRSITSSKLMAWFTNGNNFHVEHHLMPSLPISQLSELHTALMGRHHFYHRTYRDFFRWLLTGWPGTRPDQTLLHSEPR